MSFPSLKEQALQELGSAMVNYSRFEAILKHLIPRTNYNSDDAMSKDDIESLMSSTSKQTLGNLINRLFDTLYAPPTHKEDDDPTLPDGKSYSFSFEARHEGYTEEEIEKFRTGLLKIIEYRNELVHNRIATLNLDSDDECRNFIAALKQQQEELKPYFIRYQNTLKQIFDFADTLRNNPDLVVGNGDYPELLIVGDQMLYRRDEESA